MKGAHPQFCLQIKKIRKHSHLKRLPGIDSQWSMVWSCTAALNVLSGAKKIKSGQSEGVPTPFEDCSTRPVKKSQEPTLQDGGQSSIMVSCVSVCTVWNVVPKLFV